MVDTLRDCMGLVDVAESVGAINVTRKYTILRLVVILVILLFHRSCSSFMG